MKEDGIGDLYKEYEELKNKLEKEGFFDNNHKQKIPFMPKTIGVLTSKTGSVIKDIINVSTRRNPNVHIRLFPIPVQGKGAELEIADAIRIMNEKKLADVLILARGGGSIEDLWPFNEEMTARAIYNSKIPIISAVGHETDFTIADFVADLRAPTPSAAAELAVPDIEEIKRKLETLMDVGLSYIKLGQPSTQLSGGEAQRIKLATELSKRPTGKTLYILDEPTTGLHMADVDKLIQVLQKLADTGNSIVVIEHNLDVIKTCDYIIDLGPEGGYKGGKIVATGTPEEVSKVEGSYTGKFLKKYFE